MIVLFSISGFRPKIGKFSVSVPPPPGRGLGGGHWKEHKNSLKNKPPKKLKLHTLGLGGIFSSDNSPKNKLFSKSRTPMTRELLILAQQGKNDKQNNQESPAAGPFPVKFHTSIIFRGGQMF